ncbi:MAG: MacB family efflux pump subunit [Alphaproteobacteria bacterium]|nr:MacB family efflux pump subunit [Alphaproteobacteria bacterium]
MTVIGHAPPPAPARLSEAARDSDTALIVLSGVTKVYINGERHVPVLHGVSLSIARGEFVALMGSSGSGKTTLMNILGCLDRPTAGTYLFDGREVGAMTPDERAELRRESFGFVFQQYHLIATASAAENVEMPAIYAGLSQAARVERAAELLEALGLGERTHHRPNQLSGGQQQRVSIARALMNGGQVILADEPTGALDSRTGMEVMALLRELNRMGHTVIVITHEREVAAQAHRIIEIRDGLIVADNPSRQADAEIAPAGTGRATALPAPPQRPGAASWLATTGETLRMALRSLRAHILRTLLTLLGIVIGVGAVVTMLAVGDGARQAVIERISAMGSNLLLVRPGAPGQRFSGGVTTLVEADADAIAAIPNVLAALPEIQGGVTLRAGNVDYQTQALATRTDLPIVRNWPVAQGAFIAPSDHASYAPVAVLGQTVANLLFPDTDNPIGRHILVNTVSFQVIGVLTPKGATPWGADQDDVIMVPLSTGSLRLFGQRHLRSITVAVEDVSAIDETQRIVTDLLISRHQAEDFQIRNMAQVIDTASRTQDTLTILLGSVAAISLLVGGIGVMNIMLVSVTERTREIGIRMAVGARSRDIQLQFLTEAVMVSLLGGMIGVAGGLGVALLLERLGTSILITPFPALLAFGCAFATGLVFGYAPARKAANLDPVVALSSE